ncbi:MAG: tetratricopeptide repeat protein [Gemmatimonadales bacterium]
MSLAPAGFERALAAQQAGRVDEAITLYRRIVARQPGFAPAHFNLGLLYLSRNELAEAVHCFEGAARLRPTAADAWLNLGAALERLERLADAVLAYDRVIGCAPEDVRGPYNRGNALLALGRMNEAEASFRAVLELDEHHVDAQWNLATALLGQGQLAQGWEQYEWRWKQRGLDPASRFGFPLWAGEPLAGKRILVWREQGIGDEILFATCVRDLVAAGAEVTFAATPRLAPLFARGLPGVRVIDDGGWGDETFDYHAPIGALPRQVRKHLTSFHGEQRLLVADSAQASRWAKRLGKLGDGLRIGICWRSGLSTPERDRHYSRLEQWAPLFQLSDVHWVNLQYDDCEAELAGAEKTFGIKIHRWKGEDLRDDLESVVGLLWNLDGVVTAPTAVGSLAGGAGVRTWQVDVGGDWTCHGRSQSPWFPSLSVRSRPYGSTDWRTVFEGLAGEIEQLAARELVVA